MQKRQIIVSISLILMMVSLCGKAYASQKIIVLTNINPNITVTTNTTATIYGSSGINHVTIESGANVRLINFPNKNIFTIKSNSNLFNVSRSGATVTFRGEDGTILKMPATLNLQQIIFNDKIFNLVISNKKVQIGDQIITLSESSLSNSIPNLKVYGQEIIDSQNNTFVMRAMGFNHYFEYAYESSQKSIEEFRNQLSWLHTEEDYAIVKNMGYNAVRFNFCYWHVDDEQAFKNMQDHVERAKNAGLYIVLDYTAPPGVGSDGKSYLDLTEFFSRVEYQSAFIDHWDKISNTFKNESHVLFEILNEPQDCTEDQYIALMESCIKKIKDNGAKNVIIIDGLNFAGIDSQNYNFITELNKDEYNQKIYENVIYSFHYYLPKDFLWQGCGWNNDDCNKYRDGKVFFPREGMNNWQKITKQVIISNNYLEGKTAEPGIFLISSSSQTGKYFFRNIKVSDANDNVIFFLKGNSFTDTKVNIKGEQYIWRAAMDPTNPESSFVGIDEIDEESYISISNSGNWANFQSPSQDTPLKLSNGEIYNVEFEVRGKDLISSGKLDFAFMTCTGNWEPVYNSENIEVQQESDLDLINKDFAQIKQIAYDNNVPFILGEFGVPNHSDSDSAFKYFKSITETAEKMGFGWIQHNYRDKLDNGHHCGKNTNESCADSRVLGLYSGWGLSVSAMKNGGLLGDDINANEHYYNKSLIEQITDMLINLK